MTTAPPDVKAPEMDDFDRANTSFAQSQYADTIDKAKKAIAANPKSEKVPTAMLRIAQSLDELNKPKEAAAAYKEFIAKNPTYDKTGLEKANKRAEFLANSNGGFKFEAQHPRVSRTLRVAFDSQDIYAVYCSCS